MVQQERRSVSRGRLSCPPTTLVREQAATGLQPLALDGVRDGFLYVPASYQPEQPLPLVLMLHGAGGTARGSLDTFLPTLENVDTLLLVPDSRGATWDVIEERGYGSDVLFIDRALRQTLSRYAVDRTHLAIGGFSDGASYALSLGLTNGDLFTHILAFSPGFLSPAHLRGQPEIYISHGIHDTVLPINRCSRRIVLQLQQDHYHVYYHEFEGGHAIPGTLLEEAWRWFRHTDSFS